MTDWAEDWRGAGEWSEMDDITCPEPPPEKKFRQGQGKPYPKEVRREAAQMYLMGAPAEGVARIVGCTSQALYGWARALKKEMEAEDE